MYILCKDIQNIINKYTMKYNSIYTEQCFLFLEYVSDISISQFNHIWELHLFRLEFGYIKNKKQHKKTLLTDLNNIYLHSNWIK